MERILNDRECDLLEKIARHTKMDTWFWIDENGIVKDAERQSKSQRKLIHQLIDGINREDFDELSDDDKWTLLQILNK